jgi:hypothetical protein
MFKIGKGAGKVVGDALGGVGKILDSVITSSEDRGKIDIKFNELQTKINELEAGSASLFVSGWRPFIGWVSGVSLACFYIPQYVLGSFLWVKVCLDGDKLVEYPLTTDGLMPLVTSMLGFGAIRTYEKIKGKNRN